jgi:hypothetical protein
MSTETQEPGRVITVAEQVIVAALAVDSTLTQHPASWALLHPNNYRGICLADAVPMVFQMGLLDSLLD